MDGLLNLYITIPFWHSFDPTAAEGSELYDALFIVYQKHVGLYVAWQPCTWFWWSRCSVPRTSVNLLFEECRLANCPKSCHPVRINVTSHRNNDIQSRFTPFTKMVLHYCHTPKCHKIHFYKKATERRLNTIYYGGRIVFVDRCMIRDWSAEKRCKSSHWTQSFDSTSTLPFRYAY